MSTHRRWFCKCGGTPQELSFEQLLDEEVSDEPVCERCGASPSSDPKHTISFRDEDDYED